MDILLSERIDHPEHLNQEWLILPIHKYYPQWYHPKRLEKELKARIRVTVADT
jgi:7,8-dihydro-6-hydroxymethylpterin-pyrophosphokinase